MTCRSFVRLFAATAIGLAALAQGAFAQNYPTKPITFIVPFGAGGGTDVSARTVADVVSKELGQSIIVESRPGANGAIGSGIVAKAAPDGYTLLYTAQSTYSLNPNLMKDLPYDQLKDFIPVATISDSPWYLVVGADSPFKTVEDIVKFAKANPDKVTIGFWQSTVMVTGVAFGKVAGIQLRRVPYKGAVEAATDLAAGRLSMLFGDTSVIPMIESKKLRILAVTTKKRSQLFPDVPTTTELGYPVVSSSAAAVFAPAGTPRPIVDKLNAVLSKAVNSSQVVRDRMKSVGQDPLAMSVGEVDAFVKSELTRWGQMIADAGLEKQ